MGKPTHSIEAFVTFETDDPDAVRAWFVDVCRKGPPGGAALLMCEPIEPSPETERRAPAPNAN